MTNPHIEDGTHEERLKRACTAFRASPSDDGVASILDAIAAYHADPVDPIMELAEVGWCGFHDDNEVAISEYDQREWRRATEAMLKHLAKKGYHYLAVKRAWPDETAFDMLATLLNATVDQVKEWVQ